jgi:uncharacterized OB-fold protein
MSAERMIPAPRPSADTQPFWDAAGRGEFLLKYCNGCGKHHYYPRAICPLCGSSETEWRKSTGMGTIFSCSVLRRTEVPYCLAYVELDEGPVILSNIVDTNLDAVKIGQKVKVVFKPAENGQLVPMFAPAPTS